MQEHTDTNIPTQTYACMNKQYIVAWKTPYNSVMITKFRRTLRGQNLQEEQQGKLTWMLGNPSPKLLIALPTKQMIILL